MGAAMNPLFSGLGCGDGRRRWVTRSDPRVYDRSPMSPPDPHKTSEGLLSPTSSGCCGELGRSRLGRRSDSGRMSTQGVTALIDLGAPELRAIVNRAYEIVASNFFLRIAPKPSQARTDRAVLRCKRWPRLTYAPPST